ncbi:hypothetical protein A7982_13661 [Minicystis rosea]|nr:hypothetical protein A7982_13661 [Minicystis rosea]
MIVGGVKGTFDLGQGSLVAPGSRDTFVTTGSPRTMATTSARGSCHQRHRRRRGDALRAGATC